jgi:hypothetical protein
MNVRRGTELLTLSMVLAIMSDTVSAVFPCNRIKTAVDLEFRPGFQKRGTVVVDTNSEFGY